MRKTIKMRLYAGSLFSLFVVACVLMMLIQRPAPNLLEKAVCLTRRAITNHLFLLSHHNNVLADWKFYPGTTTQKWTLDHFDILTGKQFPLKRLSHLVNESGAGMGFNFQQCTSDGQHLLWPTDNLTAMSADLSGSHSVRWNCGDLRELHWLPDNRHWFGLVMDAHSRFTGARIYDRQDPGKVISLRTIRPVEFDQMNFLCSPSSKHFLSTSFSGPYDGIHDYGSIPKVNVTRWTFSTDMTPTANYTISISPNSKIVQIEASSDGKRLLFVLLRRHESPLTRIAGQLWKGFRAQPHYTVELEISDIDGQNKRLVGVESEPANSAQESERVYGFFWEPDGRHIGFWHDDRLWTILAD